MTPARGSITVVLGDGTLPPQPLALQPATGASLAATTGSTVQVPAGPLHIEGAQRAGLTLDVDVPPGEAVEVHLAATLTVMLGDAGGRALGGLQIEAEWLDGACALRPGRVGHPMVLPPGRVRLSLAVDPPQRIEVEITAGEAHELQLGRLSSLMVTYTSDAITHGAPFSLQAVEGGHTLTGHLGEELQLWPGEYSLHLEPAGRLALPPDRALSCPAGALVEVELGKGASAQRARVLVRELTGALSTVGRRLKLPSPPSLGRSGRRALTLGDARRRPLRREIELRGPSTRRLWAGDVTTVPPGRYGVSVFGLSGSWTAQISEGGPPHVGDLGAIEVHLKDPEALSLRFAPLELRRGEARWQGRVGVPLQVPPGVYTLYLPSLPGFERDVVVQGGEITQLDLGLAGVLELPDDVPTGAPVRIWREDTPEHAAPLAEVVAGAEILLPLGTYRVQVSSAPAQQLDARRKRKNKPSVAVRFIAKAS